MLQTCNASIKVWNWALAAWNKQYDEYKEGNRDKKPNASSLSKEFTNVWRSEIPWLVEVQAKSYRETFRNLNSAWANFFRGLKQGRKVGSPQFKSVKDRRKSFYVHNQQIKEDWPNRIHIAGIGWLKLRRDRRFGANIVAGRVSYDGLRWHLSLQFDYTPKRICKQGAIGVDRGGVNSIADSNGNLVQVPIDRKIENRIKRHQRKLSRKKKGSNNYKKQRSRLAKLLRRVADKRENIIHAATKDLAQYEAIFIEDLDIQKMTKKGKKSISKSVLNSAPFEIERQLGYKSSWSGSELLKVPSYYTSQRCNECGHICEQNRHGQIFECVMCGFQENADISAARNILHVGISGEDLTETFNQQELTCQSGV